jgi:lipoprotein-releasing system permease protein
MSLSCIVLGVGLFIITQATTSGFESFFIQTILGTNGALRIEDKLQDTLVQMRVDSASGGSRFEISNREGRKYIEGVEEPRLVAEGLRRFRNVSGISEVLTGAVVASSPFKNEAARVFGIVLENHLGVSDLGRQIIQGSLSDFATTPAGILVGSVLAQRLQLSPGSSLTLEAQGQIRRYRVSAIFETGVSDIDKVRIYMHLGEVRSLLKKATGASFIQLNLVDTDRAPQDAFLIEETLRHSATSWQEREKTWLEVFRALRLSTGVTVSVFTLIAGLAMFNTLAMIVMEKTKDIAILRSMGYTRQDISFIFLWQAVVVLVIGAFLGCLLGAGGTWAISRWPVRIRGIFATDTFIVAWSVWHYVAAVMTAVVMVMLASLVPARRAARLQPGDIIRGTSQ